MKNIKNYLQFIKESHQITLTYYCFDWDDNILSMPTKINMEKLVDGEWIPTPVSTEHFAEIRNDKDNWKLGESPFVEFGDDGPRGDNAFLEDMKEAIGGAEYPQPPIKKAPSWDKFIQCLVEGSMFSIITARSTKPETLRKGVEWIIDNYLDDSQKEIMYNNCLKFNYLFGEEDKYERIPSLENISKHKLISSWLDHCGYYGVSYKGFIDKHKSGGAESPEKGKELAIKEFIAKCAKFANSIGAKFKTGMSDDDMRNVMHMKTVLSELKDIYPDSELTVFDTSKGGYQKRDVRSKFHGVEEGQSWPNEGSIQSFNNFSQELNRMPGNDPRQPNLPLQDMRASQLAKISKDSLEKKLPKFSKKKKISKRK